jgi:hypothetical protein
MDPIDIWFIAVGLFVLGILIITIVISKMNGEDLTDALQRKRRFK